MGGKKRRHDTRVPSPPSSPPLQIYDEDDNKLHDDAARYSRVHRVGRMGNNEVLDEKNPLGCAGDVHSVDLLDEILASALLIDVGRIFEEDEAKSSFHVLGVCA